MRCLAIDYGTKRVGLAWADELALAHPLAAEARPSIWKRLAAEIAQRRITQLVIGYPYNMDGTVGPKAQEVDAFCAELDKRYGLPVARVDERLTSDQVERDLYAAGAKPKRDRKLRASGIVDSAAAALILQDYLDTMAPPPLLAPDDHMGDHPDDDDEAPAP